MRCLVAAVMLAGSVCGLVGSSAVARPQKRTQPSEAASPAAAAPQEPAAPAAAAPKSGWTTRCVSSGRKGDADCSLEETAVLKTGQVVVRFSIAVPGATHTPVAVVQVPLGIFVPPGATIAVDRGKPLRLPIETCNQGGCFASSPLSADFLGAMKTGEKLIVSFTTVAKETANVTLPLASFAPAYANIE